MRQVPASLVDARVPSACDLADLLCVYEHACLVPPLPDGLVPRVRLLEAFANAAEPSLVLVSGPAGSGKTSLVVQATQWDGLPVAWVTVDPHAAAPMPLLHHVAVALHGIEPLPDSVVSALRGPDETWTTVALPRLLTAIRRRDPFQLVIDDVHLLTRPDALDCLEHLIAGLPAHARMVLSSRAEVKLRLGPVHQYRRVVRIGPDALGFSCDEASAFARSIGLDLRGAAAEQLVERMEGWAAGVCLSVWAMKSATGRHAADPAEVEAPLVSFLEKEVLDDLPAAVRTFLTRTSILRTMTGGMCDAVLDTQGSGALLDKLAREGHLFVTPLDDGSRWFRVHAVFRQLLYDRLVSDEPDLVRPLHARASTWFEGHGDLSRAIVHARRAGQGDRAADLAYAEAFDLSTSGRSDTLADRLASFSREEIEASAPLCLAEAIYCISTRRFDEIDDWIARAGAIGGPGPLSDGTPSVDVAVSALRAMVASEPADAVLADLARHGPIAASVSSLWTTAAVLTGILHFMKGAPEATVSVLRHAEPGWVRSPALEAGALAYLALIAAEEGDDETVARHTARAARCLATHDLGGNVLLTNPLLILALLDARDGRTDEAQARVVVARRALAGYGPFAPRGRLLAMCLLAEVQLCLGELDGVEVTLAEAEPLVNRERWAVGVLERIERVRSELAERTRFAHALGEPGPASLTPAELRVLSFLPTHLSLREIGERTFRSPHTVKSQTVSAYRKLGVSSRSGAVQRAQELGLIDS